MARRPAPDTRERILEAADRLFYEVGVHAVGTQQIIEDCGCGKNLLYREFPSKDDLVGAYLERRQDVWRHAVEEATAPLADDPAGQLIAIVNLAADQVRSRDYRGCPFLKAHAEHAELDHAGQRIPVLHQRELNDQLLILAKRARLRRPRETADRIMLIIQGLYATGAVLGDEFARTAVDLAEQILDDASPGGSPPTRRAAQRT